MTKNQIQETLFNLFTAMLLFVAIKISVGGWLLYSIDQQYGHTIPWHETILNVGIFVLVTVLFGLRMKSIMRKS